MADIDDTQLPDRSVLGPSVPAHSDVVIVGAGLAGLAAASTIQRTGRTVTVLEASDGVGGRVRTDELDGFLLDRGFQVLLTAYPELERQIDGTALDLQYFAPGAVIWLDGRAFRVGDPLREPSTLFRTATAPIGSLADKIRIAWLRERLRRASTPELLRGEDTSTAEYLAKLGFSTTMIERFIGPLFAGIQLDPELGTSRRMFDTIFRSLTTGAAAVPARGMQALPNQMAATLHPGTVHLQAPVAEVHGGGVSLADGRVITAEAVVVATEGPAAAALLDLPVPGSRSVSGVYFAAPKAPVSGNVVILDGTSRGPALNVTVMTETAASYGPGDQSLIVASCPGDTGADLEERVRVQLTRWWGSQVHDWRHLRTYRIAHGQPDQSPPFAPKQRVHLGDRLFVCGDHRDTGSIQGALFSGRRTGDAVVHSLAHA